MTVRPVPTTVPRPPRFDWWAEAMRLVQAVLFALASLAMLHVGLTAIAVWMGGQ